MEGGQEEAEGSSRRCLMKGIQTIDASFIYVDECLATIACLEITVILLAYTPCCICFPFIKL